MRSEDGVLSIPFRLAISVVVLSLAIPICSSCIDSCATDLSRKAAVDICQRLARAIEVVAEGGIGERRIVELGDRVDLLNRGIKITVGDYPAGPNSDAILCSDAHGWERVFKPEIDDSILGICSSALAPYTIPHDSKRIIVAHQLIDGLNLIILRAG